MSMTREEAIKILEDSKRQNEVMRDNPSTFWTSYQMAEGVENSKKRIAALDLALAALHGPTREMVERMRGEWIRGGYACGEHEWECSKCHGTEWRSTCSRLKFCPFCGAPMTDEAVDMVMKRLEATRSGKERLP